MSRFDRLVARKAESPRKVRSAQKLRAVIDRFGKVDYVRPPHHVQGDRWWRRQMPDIAERALRAMQERAAKRERSPRYRKRAA